MEFGVEMDKLKEIFCAVFRHSRIQDAFMGYYSCGRCGTQLGDSLGSIYPSAQYVVIIGHRCRKCKANYKECNFIDKFLVGNPFSKP